MNKSPSVGKTNQGHKLESAVKKLEVIMSATGKMRCIQITLRVNKTFFKATIDTGSPASFINKKTADILLKSGTNVKLLSTSELHIDTHHVDYSRRTIKLFGALIAEVSSLGWQITSAKFLVSENSTRCLLGLDLQSSWGVQTTKTRPTSITKISSPPTDSAKWRKFFMNKLKKLFTRQGRSKNHRVHSVFKDPLVETRAKSKSTNTHPRKSGNKETQ